MHPLPSFPTLPTVPPIKRGTESSYVNLNGATLSGRVTKTIGVQEFWGSMFHSHDGKFRLAKTYRYGQPESGFATADEAQAAIDHHLVYRWALDQGMSAADAEIVAAYRLPVEA